jgi:hypothetical protein
MITIENQLSPENRFKSAYGNNMMQKTGQLR